MSHSRFLAALAFVALAAVPCACRSSVNPDQGRFSCATDQDCGSGWECRPQFSGGGFCFRDGECRDTETCNGSDDNCDGRTDEAYPEQGDVCLTGLLGECSAGAVTCCAPDAGGCLSGTLFCQRLRDAGAETCNGKDDDCNGTVDDPFDFSSDEAHCGGCNRGCDAGTSCLSGLCEETACDDGVDNDLDQAPDCDDDSCFAQPCLTPMPPTRRCGALPADGGVDGGDDGGVDGGVDAGVVRGCFAPEADCANAVDDDGDGLTDCDDLDCDGRTCFSGTQCTLRVCPGPG